MTDAPVSASTAETRAELSRLRLPELLAIAAERGISGASKLRKGELVDTLSDLADGETTPVIDAQDAPVTDDATAERACRAGRRRAGARAAPTESDRAACRRGVG